MKILFAGFGGKYNPSKILLDHIQHPEDDKLYLVNSYKTSVPQLNERLDGNDYDYAIIFGQGGRMSSNVIKLEKVAKKGRYIHQTSFPIDRLAHELKKYGFRVEISNFAGRWLCNNVYFYGLKHIEQTGRKCKIVFIHIPRKKELENYAKLAEALMTSTAKLV